MKLLICAALIACVAAPDQARRRAQRRPRRAARRKSMPKTNQTPAPADGPVLDGPNRMEIDPADIPPSQRPRDPNVDDRTRIPSEVSPDDMAPAARKPKKRKP